ncbi:MAG: hypothetical protein AB2551_15890 [Candidatus Thiodiazotropha sp.]
MVASCNNSGDIHLADLISALSDLPWRNEEQASKIAAALGFSLQNPQQHKLQKNRSMPGIGAIQRSRRRQKPPSTKKSVSTPPAPTPKLELPDGALPGTLTEVDDLPPSIDEVQQPDPAYERFDDHEYSAVNPPSLFLEQTSRGLLTALLQTVRESHRIDIDKLIQRSGKGTLPRRFPYQETGTLEHGCQLLLDYADSMVPWWNDLEALTNQLYKTVGKVLVNRYQITDDPRQAESWTDDDELETWKPKTGIPNLVVTDFGLPNQHSAYRLQQRWRAFIDECEAAQSPLIFLVPWEYDEWLSSNLGGYPYLFQWSPATSASQIRSLIGIGHRVVP